MIAHAAQQNRLELCGGETPSHSQHNWHTKPKQSGTILWLICIIIPYIGL